MDTYFLVGLVEFFTEWIEIKRVKTVTGPLVWSFQADATATSVVCLNDFSGW